MSNTYCASGLQNHACAHRSSTSALRDIQTPYSEKQGPGKTFTGNAHRLGLHRSTTSRRCGHPLPFTHEIVETGISAGSGRLPPASIQSKGNGHARHGSQRQHAVDGFHQRNSRSPRREIDMVLPCSGDAPEYSRKQVNSLCRAASLFSVISMPESCS